MDGVNELRLLCLEARSRLVMLEQKVDAMTRMLGNGSSLGHPDQFFGGRTYAQHGDDLVMMCIFRDIGVAHPSYLDIGAHHPFNISNTALFYLNGCRGINVTGNSRASLSTPEGYARASEEGNWRRASSTIAA